MPPNPLTPNFIPGVGQLTTSRYDFQKHLDGINEEPNGPNFRHTADQIDLNPGLTIDTYPATTVQQALQIITDHYYPAPSNASPTVTGLITLAGDLNGVGSTYLTPRVGQIQSIPVSSTVPTNNQYLQFLTSSGKWTPTTLTLAGDVTGLPGATVISSISGSSPAVPIGTNLQLQSGKLITLLTGSILTANSGSNINLASGSNLNINSGSNITLASGGTLTLDSGAIMNSSGNISLYAGETYFTGSSSLIIGSTLNVENSLTVGYGAIISELSFAETVSGGPEISQASTNSANGQDMIISAQAATAGFNGGALYLSGGTGAVNGTLYLQSGLAASVNMFGSGFTGSLSFNSWTGSGNGAQQVTYVPLVLQSTGSSNYPTVIIGKVASGQSCYGHIMYACRDAGNVNNNGGGSFDFIIWNNGGTLTGNDSTYYGIVGTASTNDVSVGPGSGTNFNATVNGNSFSYTTEWTVYVTLVYC